MVVMRGPDATAGSTLIFLKKRGISVPTALEISIARTRDIPIQPETAYAKSAVLCFASII